MLCLFNGTKILIIGFFSSKRPSYLLYEKSTSRRLLGSKGQLTYSVRSEVHFVQVKMIGIFLNDTIIELIRTLFLFFIKINLISIIKCL